MESLNHMQSRVELFLAAEELKDLLTFSKDTQAGVEALQMLEGNFKAN